MLCISGLRIGDRVPTSTPACPHGTTFPSLFHAVTRHNVCPQTANSGQGYDHQPVNLSASWGDAALRLPAIHLVFSLAKRWLMGTHHGAVSEKHLPAYLDEYVFRFNRRTAKRISHGFARLIEQAVRTGPSTYQAIVATPA